MKFYYHTSNKCYKSYVLKKTLKAIEEGRSKREELEVDETESIQSQPDTEATGSSRITRSQESFERAQPCMYNAMKFEFKVPGLLSSM